MTCKTSPVPPSSGDQIRAAIAGAGGQIRFDEFMRLALYGEQGFYNTIGAAGRRGDFLTSPEVGPLFGAVVARWIDSAWREMGKPDDFTIVEAGAGPGTLARSIRAGSPECLDVAQYIAVEVSQAQRDRHPDWVRSTDAFPAERFSGVVIANELLDNLPLRLFVNDGGWREAFVAWDPTSERFVEVLGSGPTPADFALPPRAPHGARVPLQDAASAWIQAVLHALVNGRLLLVDYASPTTAALADRPWRDWLRTYRSHQRGEHYLRDPGTQDITAEVALDQIFAVNGEPTAIRSQQQFLQLWGIDALVEEGRRVWSQSAGQPTLTAMTMRSRVREAEALCDPHGLGSFSVIEFVR